MWRWSRQPGRRPAPSATAPVERSEIRGHAGGEEIRTEISAKFRKEGVEGELADAGFGLDSWWTDPGGRFALSLARVR